jgi:hypothetical protein
MPPGEDARPPAETGGRVNICIYIPLLACKTRKRTVVTVPGGIGKTPDNESPQRVKVVLDCTEVVEPRRVATRDEMLAAADRVFTRRGRKPTRDG